MIESRQGLKYLPPYLIFLDNVSPTKEMKGFFQENMEFDHIKDKVMTACEMLSGRESE